MGNRIHETHEQYIMDVLEEDKDRIMKEIIINSPENEYKLKRLIEITIEIVERNNNCG